MKKKISVKYLYSFLLLMFIVLVGCNEETFVREVETNPPSISSFEPLTGEVGTLITVNGEHLKNVDSAAIGSGLAVINRIINDNKIVLEVTHESKSGKVKLSNSLGSDESDEDYTFQYVIPTINEFPVEGTINNDISFTGTNLHGITGVFFDDVEAKITYQKEGELAVMVPFVPDAEWVTVTLTYNTEFDKKVISGPKFGFLVIKPPYSVFYWPSSVLKGSNVNLLGLNINLTDSVFFGDEYAEIITSAASFVTVQVPDFKDRTFVTMRVVYFGDQEIINTFETEVYPQFRKVFDNFEGGSDNFIVSSSNGFKEGLKINGDTSLTAPEGNNYIHYTQDKSSVTGAPTNSVMAHFHYDEGEENLINLGAFTDPVVHFYYNNKETPAYLQLETRVAKTVMRIYTERLLTTTGNEWQLYCYRLNSVEWYPGYAPGTKGTLLDPKTYEYFKINFKPAMDDSVHVNLDYIFVSEGAISGSYDLTNWSANSKLNPDKIPPPIVP